MENILRGTFVLLLALTAQAQEPAPAKKKEASQEGLFRHSTLAGFVPSKEWDLAAGVTSLRKDSERVKGDRSALASALVNLVNSHRTLGKCRLRAERVLKNNVVDAVKISLVGEDKKERTFRISMDVANSIKPVHRNVSNDRMRYEYSKFERRIWNASLGGTELGPELDIETWEGGRRLRLNFRLTHEGKILNLFYSSKDDLAFASIEKDAMGRHPSTDPQISLSKEALILRDNMAKAEGVVDTFHCKPTIPPIYKGEPASKYLQPPVYEKRAPTGPFGVR